MDNMNHKEQMEWYRKNDPITYYELTSDPTGVGGGDESDIFGCLVTLIIVLVLIGGGIIYWIAL